MKMSNVDGKEQEVLIKQVIRKFMKEQLNDQKENTKESNNSFVYLENSTLNMLITYMLMIGNSPTYGEVRKVNEEDDKLSQDKNLEDLDHIIAESKQEFEEIITLLKDKV